jgi:hypothetical protein
MNSPAEGEWTTVLSPQREQYAPGARAWQLGQRVPLAPGAGCGWTIFRVGFNF